MSIPEDADKIDVDGLGDVEAGRLSLKRPKLPASLPIHQCSIALLICGNLSNHASPVPLASIEKTPKHHRHFWIFSMCGPQTTSIYGFWLFLTSRTLPQMYTCLVATNVKPAVVLRIFEWWIWCWHSGGVGQECRCRVWPTTDWNSVRDCPIRHERHSSSNIYWGHSYLSYVNHQSPSPRRPRSRSLAAFRRRDRNCPIGAYLCS